jgi:menaquinone-dependent protoporphyrinogen oxidase
MSRVLVLYASHYGQTRTIALRITERLRECGAQVDLLDVQSSQHARPPDGYDAAIIGSRIELGRHAPSVIAYMHMHRDALERIPTYFFSVSMAAASRTSADPNGYLAVMFDKLGWQPVRSVAFAGALPYRKYNWLTRFIMKRISAAAGRTTDTSKNHEFTSWAAVRAFADDVYARLPGSVVAQTVL